MAKGTTKKPSTAPSKSKRPQARPKSTAPSTSKRPQARPKSTAPTTSARPKGRSADIAAAARGDKAARREARESKGLLPEKYAKGGMARGCGAATKGGKYSRGG